MSMPEKKKMQRMFDQFWKVFVTERKMRCVDGLGGCLYKNGNHGCAVGCQPEFRKIYDAGFEGRDISTLIDECPVVGELYGDIAKFVDRLQLLHDGGEEHRSYISKRRAITFAKQWELRIPA